MMLVEVSFVKLTKQNTPTIAHKQERTLGKGRHPLTCPTLMG